MIAAHEILQLFVSARPDWISWKSRVFCLRSKGMSRCRCALLGLRVGDSSTFHFSAPGFNFAVEQGILFGS